MSCYTLPRAVRLYTLWIAADNNMWHSGRGARLVVALAVIVAAMSIGLATGLAHPETAHACPSSAAAPTCANYVWRYGHSWYITNNTSTALKSLADTDASWVNYACVNNPPNPVDFMTVLDFGRPGKHNGSYSV